MEIAQVAEYIAEETERVVADMTAENTVAVNSDDFFD